MISENGSPYNDEFNPNVWLKRQAEELGMPAKNLLAMSSRRDPFNFGTPGDWEKALWFKKQHDRFGYEGIHLRRLHYRISNLGEGQIPLWDGTPYENEPPRGKQCWDMLQEAFTAARILGLVAAEGFVERRVKASRVDSFDVDGMPPPSFSVEAPYFFGLPDAPDAYATMPNIDSAGYLLGRPGYEVTGYTYRSDLQPYIIELWDEKSGDTDIMRRLAYVHGINYQPGVGYASITNIKRMLRRVAGYGKPARILYVSDLDDAGQNMPIQVGRHSQFGCWELTEVAKEVAPEIMIDNAALTTEQVERLGLPQFINTTKTEIDALEALHPGELRRILEERIVELQDTDLSKKVERTKQEAERVVRNKVNEVIEAHRERLTEIAQESDEIIRRYQNYYRILGEKMQSRYERLGERYERHIADLKEQADQEHAEIEEELENLDVDLPELPKPAVEDTDEWLFDSRRGFLDQTQRFRQAKGWE